MNSIGKLKSVEGMRGELKFYQIKRETKLVERIGELKFEETIGEPKLVERTCMMRGNVLGDDRITEV